MGFSTSKGSCMKGVLRLPVPDAGRLTRTTPSRRRWMSGRAPLPPWGSTTRYTHCNIHCCVLPWFLHFEPHRQFTFTRDVEAGEGGNVTRCP